MFLIALFEHRSAPCPASLCVALRPQPIDATASLQPLIDFGLALEALDVANLGARIVSLDLPIVLGNALVFEFDLGFAHTAVIAAFGRRGQRMRRTRAGPPSTSSPRRRSTIAEQGPAAVLAPTSAEEDAATIARADELLRTNADAYWRDHDLQDLALEARERQQAAPPPEPGIDHDAIERRIAHRDCDKFAAMLRDPTQGSRRSQSRTL
jgi:hypothetical protein